MSLGISLKDTFYSDDAPVIIIKGAGEMASGVAWKLHRCGFSKILMLEIPDPLAVRRTVSFCESIYEGSIRVDGIEGVLVKNIEEQKRVWQQGSIAVTEDPNWEVLQNIKPDVVVDAILAKRNLGTALKDGGLVIGCGPGFEAGKDVHLVIETQRGHDLGRVIESGGAIPNTGIPGDIGGFTVERVLRADKDGVWQTSMNISDLVEKGQAIGQIGDVQLLAPISGVIRGLLRAGTEVTEGLKIGDIDPRAAKEHCYTVSEKARAIGGGVLEAILRSLVSDKKIEPNLP